MRDIRNVSLYLARNQRPVQLGKETFPVFVSLLSFGDESSAHLFSNTTRRISPNLGPTDLPARPMAICQCVIRHQYRLELGGGRELVRVQQAVQKGALHVVSFPRVVVV